MRPIDAEPIEQALFKLADKSLAKNPYENARVCAFRRAFELILNAPTIALPPNDPLNLDQLREMDGEPVWCDFSEGRGCYMIIQWHNSKFFKSFECGFLLADEYGNSWLAYRHKPEG